MTSEVLDLNNFLDLDGMGCQIANQFDDWNMKRQIAMSNWNEVREYIYATDTSTTTNSKNPWKNKTHIPKVCQIRDNLYANYVRALFPKRKWLTWISFDDASDEAGKKEIIENFMYYVMDRSGFKETVAKVLLDWIDTGNCFVIPGWKDSRIFKEDGTTQSGYVGPVAQRVAPNDIVFNPIASDFKSSPKIVRDLVTLGDVKKLIEQQSTEETKEALDDLWEYIKGIRQKAYNAHDSGQTYKDAEFQVDGFDTYTSYLTSGYAELLTFYGDLYDVESGEFYPNHIITVVDRHKVISLRPNPSFFGEPQIHHTGWRERQNNLWAMGPLENLIGLQYRIDHLENLKSDIADLTAYPVFKIKGMVEDFEWKPLEKILIGDDGDVEMLVPDVRALQWNMEIQNYMNLMEEMAGAPKEALGFRTPGEKTAYEVNQLQNAASRVFQTKIEIFEERVLEPLLNSLLEMACRNLPSDTLIRVFDDEIQIADFKAISADDLTGNGRIVPMAARHFAEYAEKVQNATQFFSTVGADPAVAVNFSGLKTAEMFEHLLDLEGYDLVTPNIRVTEQADTQRLMNSQEEQVQSEIMTPSGLTPGDTSEPFV